MYAVIKTGGKQYRVAAGDTITVEKLNVEAGQAITFDEVLVMGEGADLKVGAPFVEGAVVNGEVVENGKGEKVIIFKHKPKKDYKKKQGHRQPYTMVKITGFNGEVAAPAAPAKEEGKEDLSSLKKSELLDLAASKNIKVSASATKGAIIEAIEAETK